MLFEMAFNFVASPRQMAWEDKVVTVYTAKETQAKALRTAGMGYGHFD